MTQATIPVSYTHLTDYARETTDAYNSAVKLIRETAPDGSEKTWSYDAFGRETVRIDVYKRQVLMTEALYLALEALSITSGYRVPWASISASPTASQKTSMNRPVSYTHLDVYKRQVQPSLYF